MNTFEIILAELNKRVSQLSDTITRPSFLMTTPDDKIEYIKGEIKGLLNSIETVQNLLKDKLNDVSPKDRFFYFVYSNWCGTLTGKGTLLLSSKNFPSQNYVKTKAIEQVSQKFNKPEHEISVIIENWIEMSEDDYKQFLSKD